MFKANNLACKVAIDDSSEASLLGIKVSLHGINVSFMPVLGAIKVSVVVMISAFEGEVTEYHAQAINLLKISDPNANPRYAQGCPNVV